MDNSKIAMYFPYSPKIKKVRQYSNMLQIVARRRIKIIKEP